MSPTLDTALSVAGFILITPAVLFVLLSAPFAAMMSDNFGPDAPPRAGLLVLAAIFVRPVVVIGVYVTGMLLAYWETGLTWYYPWLTLIIGGALWFTVGAGLQFAVDRVSWRASQRRRNVPARRSPQSLTGTQALAILARWGNEHGRDIAVDAMSTERFPGGWLIGKTLPDTSNDTQRLIDPGAGPVYLLGDSRRVIEVAHGSLTEAVHQFRADEAAGR